MDLNYLRTNDYYITNTGMDEVMNNDQILNTPRRKSIVSVEADTPITSTCTASTFLMSDDDDWESVLVDALTDLEHPELPWHAIELGSNTANRNNPLGVTKLFREEIRGDRRDPDYIDLYQNVYGRLIEKLAGRDDSPMYPDELFFVRNVNEKEKKKNKNESMQITSAVIYRKGNNNYERFEGEHRDAVVKNYINQKRYSPTRKERKNVPPVSGPSVHWDSSALPPLRMDAQVSSGEALCFRTYVDGTRNDFNDLCGANTPQNFRCNRTVKNFDALLTCMEAAGDGLKDQDMIRDLVCVVSKHWAIFVMKLGKKPSNTNCEQRRNDDFDDDYGSDDFEGENGPGASKKSRTSEISSGSKGGRTHTSSGSNCVHGGVTPTIRSRNCRQAENLKCLRNKSALEDNFCCIQTPQASLNVLVLDRNSCNAAAESGNLALLQLAHNEACPWDSETCEKAAEHGHLAVLQWAHQNGCPWDIWACAAAAQHGHTDVLQWLHENGCPWDERTCALAASNGHLEILQWARDNRCPWDQWTCTNAAKNGHLQVLQWARGHGCEWNSETCCYAAMNGHLDVLQWARANGCAWNSQVCTLAMEHNRLNVLEWARANGCPEVKNEPLYTLIPPTLDTGHTYAMMNMKHEALMDQPVIICHSIEALPLVQTVAMIQSEPVLPCMYVTPLIKSNEVVNSEQRLLSTYAISLVNDAQSQSQLSFRTESTAQIESSSERSLVFPERDPTPQCSVQPNPAPPASSNNHVGQNPFRSMCHTLMQLRFAHNTKSVPRRLEPEVKRNPKLPAMGRMRRKKKPQHNDGTTSRTKPRFHFWVSDFSR
jgi:hypothetical protein